jgi:DNA-binding LytR/AlgR family response regulator
MKVIIIEDEKPAARRLKRLIADFNIEVVAMLHSVEESINWLKENQHPDLIFLDIQLSDGLAFEIFEQIPTQSFIIFTTAYDEYALKAFKLNSIDYLLKPIDDEELKVAIEKYQQLYVEHKTSKLDFEDLRRLIFKPTEKEYKKRFTVKVGQHLKSVLIDEIECFYSENKGTFLHTVDNRSYLLDTTLEQLQEILNPAIFFRINRKFYINIHSIKDIISYSNSRLKIYLNHFNELEIIVSREKVNTFKSWLG